MPDTLAFLLDFDGTITTKDMSVALVRQFAKPEELEKAQGPWLPRDWFTVMAALLPPDKDRMLNYVLDTFEIRKGFKEFVTWAQDKGYGLAIATDGFGFYVEPVLDLVGAKGIRVFRNRMEFEPELKGIPGHPHEECPRCGTCKVGCLRDLKSEYETVLFAGDGDNDKYPAVHADAAFARARLRDVLERESRPFIQWESFYDIMRVVNGSFAGGALLRGPSASKCPVSWD